MPARRTLAVFGALTLIAVGVAVLLPSNPGPASATGVEVVAIAAGGNHTCALTTEGGVKCWGDNSSGQLGIGSTDLVPHTTPEDVVGLATGVTAIGAGDSHTCALTDGRGVKCWGDNSSGQLGDGSTVARATPVDVSGLTDSVNSISLGSHHTCAVVGDLVRCWGNNSIGQLGDAQACGALRCATPVDVSGLDGSALAVTTGLSHSCALRLSPAPEFFTGFQCWGSNGEGHLGDDSRMSRFTPVDTCADATCTARLGGSAIEAGGRHTCAIVNGRAKCWGANSSGQLGDAQECIDFPLPSCTTPVDVCADSLCTDSLSVSSLAGGDRHTCALTPGGGLKCWGANDDGELGRGDTTQHAIPVDVSTLTSGVTAVDAGRKHSCAVTLDGDLLCWGSNLFGQLGDGTTDDRLVPVAVVGLGGKPIATPTATPTPADTVTPTDTATPSSTPTPEASEPTGTPPVAATATSTSLPPGSPTPALLGDVDCSGSVIAIDAALVLQVVAGLLGSLPCPDAADTNGDGEVTSVDAALILQLSAGLIGSLQP